MSLLTFVKYLASVSLTKLSAPHFLLELQLCQIFVCLIESHRLCTRSSHFFILFSLFTSDWVISKSLSSWLLVFDLPCCRFSLLHFYFNHQIFSFVISVWVFFMVFNFLQNFSFCAYIFPLVSLNCLLCFLQSIVSSKQLFLIPYWLNYKFFFLLLRSVIYVLLSFFDVFS